MDENKITDVRIVELGPEAKELMENLNRLLRSFSFTTGGRLQIANIPVPVGESKDALESIPSELRSIRKSITDFGGKIDALNTNLEKLISATQSKLAE